MVLLPGVCVGLVFVLQAGPLTHQTTISTGLDSPARIAVTNTEILVTDTRSEHVLRYDLAGNPLGVWNEPAGPVGIAVHSDGRIFVSRRDDAKVAVYDAAFTFQQFLGQGVVNFVRPTDLAFDLASNRLFVVDSGADRLYAFDGTTGALALMLGVRGSRFSEFKYPSAVAVDAVNHRILVADQDNFRVQVFDTSGIFLFNFGYRIKYLPDGSSEGWFPRVAGLAVDGLGRIYITDAVMGTLRMFDSRGAELGKVVGYGSAPGDLQTPCGAALDASGRVLVANSNIGTVEVYDAPALAVASNQGTFYAGTNESPLDIASRIVDMGSMRLPRLVSIIRKGPREGGTTAAAGWEPPHMLTDTTCARCHNINGAPAGQEATVAGQTNLCLSCHSAGGHALESALRTSDRVIAGSTPPASGGRSHAWGVSAINSLVGSDGPPVGGDMAQHLSGGQIKCATCHNQHNNTAGSPFLRVNNDEGALCMQCHANHIGHTPQGAWQPTCSECHDAHNPRSGNLALIGTLVHNRTLGIDKNVLFTATTGPNSFDDGNPAANDGICQVCHTSTSYHRHDGTGTPHNNAQNCVACHPHSTGFMPAGGVSCIACHSNPQNNGDGIPVGGRPVVVNADGSGGHHLAGAVLTDNDCVTCHEMAQHQQGTVRLWSDPNNPTTPLAVTGNPAELVPFCGSCHDAMTHPATHTVGVPWEPACTECHVLHKPGDANLSLVRDVVFNRTLSQDKAVVFTARSGPNSFDDGNSAANDGICQVCHTSTRYHLQDGSGTAHNNGTDCTACHSHPAGFIPTGGVSCVGCHSAPQGVRRAVVGEFSRASHHVHGAAVTDNDCLVCHEMSGHQQGSVRLNNADDPANPALTIALTGNPMVTAAEALKLEPFCLSCHDSNGAGGSPPFANGIMPVPVDATAWSGASHRVASLTCMGDGETFGCHSTGHGSLKRTLLAPATAAQPPVSGDPLREEEGMCYSCHDANGPATTNIQSMFARLTHHKVSSLEQVDGSKVECKNCHDPHKASVTSPLIDPDTGGVWTAGGPAFCLACHDGAPPAGVTFPATSPGTGFNKSAFVGTTHATQLGGNTCRHCHEDHGSAYTGMLFGQYVVTDNNSYAAADYAACWVCHSAASIVNGNNHFADFHQKHVNGEQSPCIICHDTHRSFDAGEPGLINFELAARSGNYDFLFISGRNESTAFYLGNNNTQGFCLLQCHGKNHLPQNYARGASPAEDCTACH